MKAEADISLRAPTGRADTPSQGAGSRALGFDDFIEDLFGLNLRGLRTLRDSLVRPWEVARSAAFPDWRDRHTPTFRLWFAMIALGLFSQFLWASPGSSYFDFLQGQVRPAIALVRPDLEVDTIDATGFTSAYLKIQLSILPFLMAMAYFAVAAVLRVTEEPVSFVRRQRLVFLAPLPGAALAAILYVIMGFTPERLLFLFLAAMTLASSALLIVTAYRGIFTWGSRSGRFWRSIGFFALHMGAVTVASLISQYIAVTVTLPRFL